MASVLQPELVESFAERLRRIGAEFDREVYQQLETALQGSQRETRLLRDEIEWLQRQLEDERQQSAARLGLCAELKRQLEEAQEMQQQEQEAREYWQNECMAFEEKHGLLEAKLAAMNLEAEDPTPELPELPELETPGAEQTSLLCGRCGGAAEQTSARAVEREGECQGECLDSGDCARIEAYLCFLEDADGDSSPEALRSLSAEGLHTLLLSAVRQPERAGPMVHRVARLWASRLLNRHGSAALRSAVCASNLEALTALLGVGGPDAVVTAQTAETPEQTADSDGSRCLLSLCVEHHGDAAASLLLENLRGAGHRLLPSIRGARDLAVLRGAEGVKTALTTHLVVELSLLGNTRYRESDFPGAIAFYDEAIALCEGGGAEGGEVQLRMLENLVRLRYNLARALHRLDRWTEARAQASKVLLLDPDYANAYAIRAQAAMSSLDFRAALQDWERLVSSCFESSEVTAAWERRREECARQLQLGHYEALELPRLSDLDQVRRQYRALARRWHPDKQQHKTADQQQRAARRFGRVQEAYEVLGDEAGKRAYDTSLENEDARERLLRQFEARETFDFNLR